MPLNDPAPSIRWLGADICIQADGDLQAVFVRGNPLIRFDRDDEVARACAAALLAEGRFVKPGVLEEAFGLSKATLWRRRQALSEGGIGALVPQRRGPKRPHKVRGPLVKKILELDAAGHTDVAIARRLAVVRQTVAKVIEKHRPAEPRPAAQAALPMLAPSDAPAPQTIAEPSAAPAVGCEASECVEPPAAGQCSAAQPQGEAPAAACAQAAPELEKVAENAEALPPPAFERAPTPEVAAAYALLGLSPDGEAEVVFESGQKVANAGWLLAVPALCALGLVPAVRGVYQRLKKGIYGLRATALTLFAMALIRMSRPEALKRLSPEVTGDALGLARVPEVKTLRRKLSEIDEHHKAHELVLALARRWAAMEADALGVLYVDGHVRVLHSKKRKLPKAWVAQARMCLPATTDYWLHDAQAAPLMVITAPANDAMTRMLPSLLAEAQTARGGRKGLVVFDRGGWSPKLFKQLVDAGWDILTYRKGKRRKHPRSGFEQCTGSFNGRKVEYWLSERTTRLSNGLKLREIAELRDDGGQTLFVCSKQGVDKLELACRMFGRWRQENFFNYMERSFDLDALACYRVEAADPNREIPNPERKRLDEKVRAARQDVRGLEQQLGVAAAGNQESKRRTMRGFKAAHCKLGKALKTARAGLARLVARRRKVPKRAAAGEVLRKEDLIQLAPETKLFTDAIKMTAYRAESILLSQLRPHFKRSDDEGRAFLQAAMKLRANLTVEQDIVRVELEPMSAPRLTRSLAALCAELNRTEPRFPETTYRLEFAVGDADRFK